MKQYNSSMKISEIKKDMRVSLMKEIEDFLKTKYEIVGQVSGNEIGVAVGTYNDEGFVNDTACLVKVVAKPFYFKETEQKEIEAYDIRTLIKEYQEESRMD